MQTSGPKEIQFKPIRGISFFAAPQTITSYIEVYVENPNPYAM